MVPEDIWRRQHGPLHDESERTDEAKAAVAYEWDLLGDTNFVQVMSIALSLAGDSRLRRWTAILSCPPASLSVKILKHLRDGDDGREVKRHLPLHDLLLHHMPRWSLYSVSTEEGSSAPVFGLPERRLQVTAFRPGVWAHEAGIVVRIPRFYSWQALRTHARGDFRVLMDAMARSHPKLHRSQDNAYAYARRVRDELREAGWEEQPALVEVQRLSTLTNREIQRLGYKGRGGEGR